MPHTCYALEPAELQRLLRLLSCGAHLLPDVREVAGKCRNDVVASRQVELGDFVLVVVASLLGLVRCRVDLLGGELQNVGEGAGWQGAFAVDLPKRDIYLARGVCLEPSRPG